MNHTECLSVEQIETSARIGGRDAPLCGVGSLNSDFNFTSKTLLVKVILLVKLDQHSKKDLV